MAVNAQAVVDVQVNAQAFTNFMALFQKWKAQVATVPQQMAQIVALQKQMVVAQTQANAMLGQSVGSLDKLASRQKDIATHSETTSHRWKDMVKHGKEFAHWIGETHARIMKWSGIIAGVITGMGAASGWGLTGLAQWVRGGAISASKVSMGSHELRAVKSVFGDRYGLDVEGIAKATTSAQGNPVGPEAYALQGLLGIDPTGLTGTKKVTAVLQAWRAKLKSGEFTPETMAQFSQGVLSADQGHVLMNMSDDAFRKDIARVPGVAEDMKLPAKTEEHWQDFLTKLGEATEKLKQIMTVGLEPILDMITKNSDKWLKQLEEFMKPGGKFSKFLEEVPPVVERFGNVLKAAFGMAEEFFKKMGWIERTAAEKDKAALHGEERWEDMTPAQQKARVEAQEKAKQELIDSVTSAIKSAARSITGYEDQPAKPRAAPRVIGNPPPDGSYQDGTPMVPKTGSYTLHKGEMVLPEHEADLLRHSSMADWKRAISGIESGGNYGAVNRVTGASGKYQVMPANIADWTRQAGLGAMSIEQFRASPYAQERVFETIFGQYVSKFGNPVDAASAWFSGQPLTGNKAGPDAMGTTVPGYIKTFLAGLGAHSGRQDININDNTGGNVTMALSQSALVSIPLHPI